MKILKRKTVYEKLLKFNEDNDFGKAKVSTFPFLVTTGNGVATRASLIEFFDNDFVASEDGVLHTLINKYIYWDRSILNILYPDISSTLNIRFEDYKCVFINFEQYTLQSKEIAKYIDYAIGFITDKRMHDFAVQDTENLVNMSKRNTSYKYYIDRFQGDVAYNLVKESFNNSVRSETFELSPISY